MNTLKRKLLTEARWIVLSLVLILGVIPFTPLSPFTGQKVVAADVEEFVFEVTVPANGTFRIPVSGLLNGASNYYNWDIEWGDGGAQTASGSSATSSDGIPHTYTNISTQTYTITITPNGSTDAWLAAFGFFIGTSEANVQTNKDMVTKVVSPLTPLMTRKSTQLTGSYTPPDLEWAITFSGCTNLTMGDTFTFSASWNDIKTVGNNFANNMFQNCSGAAFTMGEAFTMPQGITTVGERFAYQMFYQCNGTTFNMNSVFNLPQGITGNVGNGFARGMFSGCYGTDFNMNSVFNIPQGITGTVGNNFAASMFDRCYGTAFTMNNVFNLPQGITIVGDGFADGMFYSCSSSAFAMNNVFNLPQGIETVGHNFARAMFYSCSGFAFNMNSVFNLPQDITTVDDYFAAWIFYGCSGAAFKVNDVFLFPELNGINLNKTGVFLYTFYNLGTASPQTRTATSIINGNEVPGDNKDTFRGSNCFVDRPYIATNWGGDGLSADNILLVAPTGIVFPSAYNDYPAVAPKTVTIYNFGTVQISNVSISVGGSNYLFGTLSDTTIPANGSINFTVSPKQDLSIGTYIDTITVSADSCADKTVGLSFAVTEVFLFEVTVPAGGTFAIPLSGRLNSTDNSYNWNIDWGDGDTQTASGIGSESSAGIPHTYATAGVYTIAIAPNASTDAWLVAFGFSAYWNEFGANVQTNKDMVTKVVSLLTPLMTRTSAQLTGLYTPPTHEWNSTFSGCTNLTMGDDFTFSEGWNDITTVGNWFASGMFSGCSGDAFTMNDVFNLPHGITTVGDYFAWGMFSGCYGIAFNMNNVFSLPQGITIVGDSFASSMFSGCYGIAFTMNNVFNLPQGITIVGDSFASSMFSGCTGDAFTMNSVFNLPLDITTVGDGFVVDMFIACLGDAFNMNSVFNLPQGITTVGDFFAYNMFKDCNGDAFNMNSVFNLPQGITAVDYVFANDMFSGCSGDAFTMNDIFNLPQGITGTVGHNFARSMFAYCYGIAFNMNSIFNLPPDITTVGNWFASEMFSGCSGDAFTMNSIFNLPPGITTVGDDFADDMFEFCFGDAFTMNSVFNLPPGITTVGDDFAYLMFRSCYGAAFNMNSVFNLPPGITTVGDSFAEAMFYQCYGDAFTMNSVFNLPQGITGTVGKYFAASMFDGCYGSNFIVNNVFLFPELNSTDLNKYNVFYRTFYNLGTASPQTRMATSIINGNEVPNSAIQTFSGSNCFVDRPYIAYNWGGIPQAITVTYDGNTNTGGSAPTDSNNYYLGDTVSVMGQGSLVKGGYTFQGWAYTPSGPLVYSEGASFVNSEPWNIVDSSYNITLYAVWQENDQYTVTVNSSYADTTGAGSYGQGTNVTINAGTRDGYTFSGWTVTTGGVTLASASSATTTFTMPANDVTVTANWTQRLYTVTVNSSYANTTGAGSYGQGTNVTINAGTRDGYTFSGWTVTTGGVTLASASSATTTFTMPANNVTVTANWTQNPA
ncbi:MAG: InlB B-repeat-containing protein, partial [Dehalococcoidia bacterium]|nr:InlB B-repeat-containing protein [Dehalococcoidia bacterium]